jgi:hypothetical protein
MPYKRKLRVEEVDPDKRRKRKGSDLKKRVSQFIKHEKLSIIPAPNRVLIRITKQQIQDLISKEVVLEDGTKKRLFFEPIHFEEGFERRFQQNISVGEIIGVGNEVEGIQVGDMAILDYLVSNLIDDTVGFVNGDQLISIIAYTTYHKESSPMIRGRQAWMEGDYDHISRILGLVRGDELIPFDPYVFMEYKPDYLKILSARGEAMRETTPVVNREVIAAPEDCIWKCGDRVKLKKDDWFDREIAAHRIAVAFKGDILCKSNG